LPRWCLMPCCWSFGNHLPAHGCLVNENCACTRPSTSETHLTSCTWLLTVGYYWRLTPVYPSSHFRGSDAYSNIRTLYMSRQSYLAHINEGGVNGCSSPQPCAAVEGSSLMAIELTHTSSLSFRVAGPLRGPSRHVQACKGFSTLSLKACGPTDSPASLFTHALTWAIVSNMPANP